MDFILFKKKVYFYIYRFKIDFKDDNRKSKLISCRSNISSEKEEEKNKFSKFSLKRNKSKFVSRELIPANSTSYIISNFFSPGFLHGVIFQREEGGGGKGRKQVKKKKAVVESAVKFALSVENFQCSPQGRKFN